MKTAGQPNQTQTFYTRQATGLVREISTSSQIALNISFMAVPLLLLVATQAPFAFPGSNLALVMLICGVLSILPVLLFGYLARAMPRSGGDYVFVSRIIHPLVGFASNFNLVAWATLAIAQVAGFVSLFALSSTFSTIGAATGNATLTRWAGTITSKGWVFGIGVILLVLTLGLMTLELRRAMTIFRGLFLLSLVGVVIAAILTLLHGRADFQAAVARFGGDYQGMIRAARGLGYHFPSGINWSATFTATPLAFTALGFAIVGAYAGGEVRSPRTTLLKGMLLSLGLAAVGSFVLMLLAMRTFGQEWLGAATFLATNAPGKYPLPSQPFYFFFVAMLTKSTALIVAMGISFVLAWVALLPAVFVIVTRSLFAWSFDRILPDKVSEVNDRTHSPIYANLIVFVAALGFLVLLAYGPTNRFVQILFTLIAGQILTFIVVSIAAAVFPYRRPDLWASSPISQRIAGVPVISIIGVLSVGVYLFFLVPLLTNDALGANTTSGIITLVGIALAPFVIYPISYFLNRARGIDLGLAFRSLPPE
jgi:APA family basic amino acid/polyamine antiporter